jgi:hypothetical protein
VLSNPHDRYGARLVWLAGFTATLALLRAVEDMRRDISSAAAEPSLLN